MASMRSRGIPTIACAGMFTICLACAGAAHSTMNIETDPAAFAGKLINREFGEFFIYPMHDETIERIWGDPKNRQLLDTLLESPTIPVEAQFLACEVFFKKDILFMRRHAPEQVAEIYAHALSHNLTGMANSWGLLYEHEDEGTVGIAFLTIGKQSIPALSRLLDDERTSLHYQGSIEATVGNGYGYRVKDFAAYYIGRIMGTPLHYFPALSDRDRQIEALKKQIVAGGYDKR